MTDEEKIFFDALTVRRRNLADHFDDPAAPDFISSPTS